MSFKPLDRGGLSRQISEQIEQYILRGPLDEGRRLPSEKELGEQFGVSRNAIREALKGLEARGLIRVENGRGAFTTAPTSETVRGALGRYIQARLTADTIDDLYEIRRVLEGAAAQACAARATQDDLRRMHDALAGMDAHQDNVDRWLEADLAFHRAMLAGTHNPFFPMLLEPIVAQIGDAIKVGYGVEEVRAGVILHREVLARIAAGDAAGAYQAMSRVLEDSVSRVKRFLQAQQS